MMRKGLLLNYSSADLGPRETLLVRFGRDMAVALLYFIRQLLATPLIISLVIFSHHRSAAKRMSSLRRAIHYEHLTEIEKLQTPLRTLFVFVRLFVFG